MLVVRADGFVDPCIPTLAAKPPAGPGWVYDIKRDGYQTDGAPRLKRERHDPYICGIRARELHAHLFCGGAFVLRRCDRPRAEARGPCAGDREAHVVVRILDG